MCVCYRLHLLPLHSNAADVVDVLSSCACFFHCLLCRSLWTVCLCVEWSGGGDCILMIVIHFFSPFHRHIALYVCFLFLWAVYTLFVAPTVVHAPCSPQVLL
eukprot:TRINITY_DN904_c0_g1_i2.p4 TRINITY_DN904_c0_g1~~TRINITY_DN904_c0_g1_i2.p4  ORF type:complete len:102 (+),score=12.89 TRINITY_DN904_c0_g1_i2:652-957(+)